MEDQQIIRLYFDRNESAIQETDSKYGKQLHLLSVLITEDQRDAQECVNDTYLETWNRIPPHKPEHLYPFLAKITRHKSIDLCRHNRAQKRRVILVELTAELETCLPSPIDIQSTVDQRFLQESINRFVRGLDRHSQYLFIRRYFFAEPISVIAGTTGKSPVSITSRLHRLRQKLKNHLSKEGITL